MAMRRPRVKVAANLAIRRPAKPTSSGAGSGDVKPGDAVAAVKVESVKRESAAIAVAEAPEAEVTPEAVEPPTGDVDSGDVPTKAEVLGSVGEGKAAQDADQSTFKFPSE